MSILFNRCPTYKEELTTRGVTTRGWYTFWSGLYSGQPTGPVSVVNITSSPFNYQAPSAGSVLVQGGTTTSVQLSRDGINFFDTGQTAGAFPVSQGDILQVSFSGALPNITFFPR